MKNKYRLEHQKPIAENINYSSSRRNSQFLSPGLDFDSGK